MDYNQEINQENHNVGGGVGGDNVGYPIITDTDRALASIATLLKESTNTVPILRREFRGEALYQYPDGYQAYIQVSKPIFIKLDRETEVPLKKKIQIRDLDGNFTSKEIYVANDEAIEEVLSMLKFMGLNQITLLTNLDENTILDDLREFECKLAALLCLKQKAWGIDKELLPMIQTKIKTIVQDARYQACNGNTIKAIQKTVQRVETSIEGGPKRWGQKQSPYI